MSTGPYPRSPKLLLGGVAHLGRMIDKVRLRHGGHLQDYNYLTAGFDQSLLDLLEIPAEEFERRVLEGGTDEEILGWVRTRGRAISEDARRQWNERVRQGGPKDEAGHARFRARLEEIARKRGVPVEQLPGVTTWADAIDLDEERW